MERSVSQAVYKGNAAGPTKTIALKVLDLGKDAGEGEVEDEANANANANENEYEKLLNAQREARREVMRPEVDKAEESRREELAAEKAEEEMEAAADDNAMEDEAQAPTTSPQVQQRRDEIKNKILQIGR